MVSVLATVRDKKGALIPNLQKEDFTILEDGKPQPIKYFTRETDLPLTIGLLVDVSGSQRNLIEIERSAASQFFREVLRKKDEAFLISFGEETELLQDYTGSPAPADRWPEPVAGLLRRGRHPSRARCRPSGSPRGTVLYDAIYLAANEKLKSEVGRKVIVVITDGVDQGSRMTRDQAIEAAQKADAVIYSIDYSDPRAYGPFGMGGGGGERRTAEDVRRDRRPRVQGGPQAHSGTGLQGTAGRDAQPVLDRLHAHQRHQGWLLPHIWTSRLANKDLKAQARKGYYAIKPEVR